ncbi:pheromone-processing carboxypeptidase KEX1-like [Senna tora]|uniref:Pheromone-processing carboxypeptidase KEX1-like n=1 Tax=Senna tora TaxID=362788 RepID=A0A834WUG4_9FABA|nr:pheromone-processing carboxypeptidase KEX1-like [Senna tora]
MHHDDIKIVGIENDARDDVDNVERVIDVEVDEPNPYRTMILDAAVLAPENEVGDTRIRDLVGWKVDQHGLVELNCRKRFSKYEPFALAQQAQQVYFVEWASKKRDRNDWWVVCKIQARSMINVPEVAYQEDEICEQYEASIDDEDANLCGGVGEGDVVEVIETEVDCMARGKGRGTIARVGRGRRTAVQNDGGIACSRLRKGRSLSQSGGSFNDEIEETPIEVPMQDGDGGNHVEEYVHQPTSSDHPNNGVASCTKTQQTDTTHIPQSNTTQTQQTKTKQLRKSPDGRIYIEPYDNSFHPHQAIREIGKIIQKQFGRSWIVWNEVPQEVKDLWFSEFKLTYVISYGYRDFSFGKRNLMLQLRKVLSNVEEERQENLQDVEKRIREEVRQEMQKEMQDMKKQIMEQLLVSYGMPIPSPPSQPLVRSVGSSTLPNKDL